MKQEDFQDLSTTNKDKTSLLTPIINDMLSFELKSNVVYQQLIEMYAPSIK